MPRYLIERDVPGIGNLSDGDIQAMSFKSNTVLAELGPEIQWQQSYVCDDKLYCVYISKNEDLIREHAKRGEFPLTRIIRFDKVVDPATAE